MRGIHRLLAVLDAAQIPATFFVTGDVARRFPSQVRDIVAAGHELGCHGDLHGSYAAMGRAEAEADIRKAAAALRAFAPVTVFRAPYLRFPPDYYDLLAENGFRVDASQAVYKRSFRANRAPLPLTCVATSVTSSVLRLPRWIRFFWLSSLSSPLVLFVHPWEFVDLRREKLRLDCRFRTGPAALVCVREVIDYLKHRHAVFFTGKDLNCVDPA